MGLYCSGTALSMAASLATVLPELSLPCRYKRDAPGAFKRDAPAKPLAAALQSACVDSSDQDERMAWSQLEA